MPVQQYVINTRDNIVGNIDGLGYTYSIRESFKADATIGFGIGVKRTGDRNVTAGGPAADGPLFGVAIRQLVTESDFRPNTGVAFWKAGDVVPILEDGMIWIQSVLAATVGGKVFVNITTGQFTSAAGAGLVEATNMTFQSSCGANELAKVYIAKVV